MLAGIHALKIAWTRLGKQFVQSTIWYYVAAPISTQERRGGHKYGNIFTFLQEQAKNPQMARPAHTVHFAHADVASVW